MPAGSSESEGVAIGESGGYPFEGVSNDAIARFENVRDLEPLRQTFHDEGEASSRPLALIMIEEVDLRVGVEQPVVSLAALSENPPGIGPFAPQPVVGVVELDVLPPSSRLAEEDQVRLELSFRRRKRVEIRRREPVRKTR
ncbi:MAG: hypothetical protein IJG47_07875 [Microbacterium sp.]|nr:hypothetical protein [Microbacterium sp.]